MQEKLDYFIERADQRFDRLDNKVDELLKFKWQIIGGSVILSSLISLLVSIIMVKLRALN